MFRLSERKWRRIQPRCFTNAEESKIKRSRTAIPVPLQWHCGSEVQENDSFCAKGIKQDIYSLILTAGRNQCRDSRARPENRWSADTRGINLSRIVFFFFFFFFFSFFSTVHPPVARFLSGVFRSLFSPVREYARPYRHFRKNSLLVRVSISNARSVKDTSLRAPPDFCGSEPHREPLSLFSMSRSELLRNDFNFDCQFGASDVNIGNRFLSTLLRSCCCM